LLSSLHPRGLISLRALTVALLLGDAGCGCERIIVFAEDFEGCAGTCGLVTEGPGRASVVSTIHPGEHGLQLEGDIAVTLPITPDPVRLADTDRSSIVTDCESGLRAFFLVSTPGEENVLVPVGIVPERVEQERVVFRPATLGSAMEEGTTGTNARPMVSAVRFEVGVGVCVVDRIELGYQGPQSTCGY
jgi:hypothetical protein